MMFYSFSVQSAKLDRSSICQIAICKFENGELVDTWQSYIDPEDYFHPRFTAVHGITAKHVYRQPTFPEVYHVLRERFENNIVVHHYPFDRLALQGSFDRHGLNSFEVKWVDSAKFAKKALGKKYYGGYNLGSLTLILGIEFQHHDALEDSIACGKILIETNRCLNFDFNEWLKFCIC